MHIFILFIVFFSISQPLILTVFSLFIYIFALCFLPGLCPGRARARAWPGPAAAAAEEPRRRTKRPKALRWP